VALIAPDFTTVALSPTSSVWHRIWSRFLDAAMAGGWDPGYGARLVDDLPQPNSSRFTPSTSHAVTPADRQVPTSCP
jgi:hypothetical protein